MLSFRAINYLGEELLQLFVKNERGGKVLICDEGKWSWYDCGSGQGEWVREREGVRGGLGRVIHMYPSFHSRLYKKSEFPSLPIKQVGQDSQASGGQRE